MKNTRNWLLILAGGVVIHSVALSAFTLFREAVEQSAPGKLGAAEGIEFAVTLTLSIGFFFLSGRLRAAMVLSLDRAGYRATRSILDTVLITELPGIAYKMRLIVLGVVGLAFLTALHGFAHVVWHLLNHGAHVPHAWLIGAGIPLTLLLAHQLRRGAQPHLDFRRGDPGPLDALILFLSEPNAGAQVLESAGPFPMRRAAIVDHFGKHNWAMPCRAISKVMEQGALRDVIVIGSTTSRPHARVFVTILKTKLPGGTPEPHLWPRGDDSHGVDFNRFEDIETELKRAFDFLRAKGARRIAIDITGGTKVCSTAGLMRTLEPGLNCLYVTNQLKVESYDVGYKPAPTGAVPEAEG